MRPEDLDPKEFLDLKTPVDYEKKYREALHFIEMTEALTYDWKTQERIRNYLIQEGVWEPPAKGK
jgi:hypothetical protein